MRQAERINEPGGTAIDAITAIHLPRLHHATVVSHACRKLTGHYVEGETPERKAFGLLAGRVHATRMEVTAVFPLLANLRHDQRHQHDFDEVVDTHAIPSETPNEQRGWMADPREVLAASEVCDEHGWLLFGNYHTHRVAWPHDPRRDSCTELDRALAAHSGMWTFILSVVDLDRPLLRAFFEGSNDAEVPVQIVPHLL